MKNSENDKKTKNDIWEEDIFDSYLDELDSLVHKYPEDLSKQDITDKKLQELIKEVDDNWMAFRKKWQVKFDLANKVFGNAKVEKTKQGMRHIVIKSNFSDKDILNLTVEYPKD